MSSNDRSENSYIAAVSMQLQQTQTLLHTLLGDMREGSSSQAELSTEMKNLRVNLNVLSNIIRGDDGNAKPLVLEVEILKHADLHLDKRMTAVVEDLEDQLVSLGKNMSSLTERFQGAIEILRKDLEAKMELADKMRRDYETARLNAEVAQSNDIRLDGRSRFQTWSTIIIAMFALAGSALALMHNSSPPAQLGK